MAIHDEWQNLLATFSQADLNALGDSLESGEPDELTFIPRLQPLLRQCSVQCIGNGNSKIYQVTKLGSTESCILKLEAWSMPQDIAERFNRNPVLNQAIAPVYSNQDCTVNSETKRIQIQPYCVGGTIESAGLKPMTDEVRLNNCQNIFQQVTKFYTALESEHILFPDGKSSNFTLNEAGQLALTDMKTYVDATPDELDFCIQINTPNYPLYIPQPPPPELSKIHSQHLGINLYAYLSGSKFTDLYYNPSLHNEEWIPKPILSYEFSKPIFSTESGKLYASLIQSTFSTDQTKRPDAVEIQRALDAIHLITQLEASPLHPTFRDFIANAKNEFKMNAANGGTFQFLVNKLNQALFDQEIMQLSNNLSQNREDVSENLSNLIQANPIFIDQLLVQSNPRIIAAMIKGMPNNFFKALISNDFNQGFSKLYTDAQQDPNKFISMLLFMPTEMQVQALKSKSQVGASVWDVVVSSPDLLAKIPDELLVAFVADRLASGDSLPNILSNIPLERHNVLIQPTAPPADTVQNTEGQQSMLDVQRSFKQRNSQQREDGLRQEVIGVFKTVESVFNMVLDAAPRLQSYISSCISAMSNVNQRVSSGAPLSNTLCDQMVATSTREINKLQQEKNDPPSTALMQLINSVHQLLEALSRVFSSLFSSKSDAKKDHPKSLNISSSVQKVEGDLEEYKKQDASLSPTRRV